MAGRQLARTERLHFAAKCLNRSFLTFLYVIPVQTGIQSTRCVAGSRLKARRNDPQYFIVPFTFVNVGKECFMFSISSSS